MCKKKGNRSFWALLGKMVALLKKEITTTIGRVNFAFDIVLAAVVATVFTANTVERILFSVISIWNPEIERYLSDTNTLVAFIIFAVFSVICLWFIYFSEKIISHSKSEQ